LAASSQPHLVLPRQSIISYHTRASACKRGREIYSTCACFEAADVSMWKKEMAEADVEDTGTKIFSGLVQSGIGLATMQWRRQSPTSKLNRRPLPPMCASLLWGGLIRSSRASTMSGQITLLVLGIKAATVRSSQSWFDSKFKYRSNSPLGLRLPLLIAFDPLGVNSIHPCRACRACRSLAISP
jgi:hypothetical protein